MLERIVSSLLDLYALVTPISIAATNIVFFPLAVIWILGAYWSWPRWPPVWGRPEIYFLVYLGAGLASAIAGVDHTHSLTEIKNKDLYIIIVILLVAFVRDREKNARLLKIFIGAGIMTAVWGLIQRAVGVNMVDKADPYFFYLPAALADWPRPVLNLLAMINGRVIGTRSHPLAYAECLVFVWSFTICYLLSARDRTWIKWLAATAVIGAALMTSQSRGPWVAAAIILLVAMVTVTSSRSWLLLGIGILFIALFALVPSMRDRVFSIVDRSHHSNKERLHMWQAGIAMWKTHPMLGVGPGNVKQLSDPYQTSDERVWGPWGHLHSNYINTLAERGIVGILSFLAFLASLGWELWQSLRKSIHDPYSRVVYQAALLGLLGFMIGGLTETSYNTAVVKMMLYFVIGLALALARHENEAAG